MNVYADNAATTRLSRRALEAMKPYFSEFFGNPSSMHSYGQSAARGLQQSRETMARLIGADPKEIRFTSGGSEADNQAILTAAKAAVKTGKRHIVASAIEHHAVLRTLEALEKRGFEITLLPVSESGIVSLSEAQRVIREDTALVSVMLANNEVGTLQPVSELAALCRERGALIHTDAVQAAGHIPVDVRALGVDMLSLSAHKFHGPKGVGALYVRRGVTPARLILGGGQERGDRAGTENIPGIVGMAAALEEANDALERSIPYVTGLRLSLIEGLASIPGCYIHGAPERSLPGIVNVGFDGIRAESLLLRLDMAGVAASSGSACMAGSLEPSHVLNAMGIPSSRAALRLSLDAENTPEEVEYIVHAVTEAVKALRR